MIFATFAEFFPEIAAQETRSMTFLGAAGKESRILHFADGFCTDPECDCRRAFLYILQENPRQMLAVVGFGWENRAFYEKWFPNSPVDLKDPAVNPGSPCVGDPAVYEGYVRELIRDRRYVERIKRHYALFKERMQALKAEGKLPRTGGTVRVNRVGRNDPCPCGSGKKYKKCCLLTGG